MDVLINPWSFETETHPRGISSDLQRLGTLDPNGSGELRQWVRVTYADTPPPEPRLQQIGPTDGNDDASPVTRMKEAPPSSDTVRALSDLEALREDCRQAGADVKPTYGLRRLLAGRARAGHKP